MIITDIVEINTIRGKAKSSYKVFINDVFAFLLSSRDINQYGLQIGEEISPDTYENIIEDVVFPKAKHKALTILSHSDRTEKEIYERLKEAYYPDEIILRTINYLKEYNYLNDERLARNYIRLRKQDHSRIVLESKLIQKGINKKVLDKIFEEEYQNNEDNEDPEILAINKIILKKCENLTNISPEEKQKLINLLYRRGFDLDKINKCL